LLDVEIRNAKRLKQLKEDVLDFTTIESNSLQLNKEEFDIKDLVIHTIQDYKTQTAATTTADNKKIRLVYHTDDYDYDYDERYSSKKDNNNNDAKILVQADKHRINQVISNLISNSIKFTTKEEAGGTISIRIKRDDDNHNDKSITGLQR
jgi:signal transduction histidine kinase